MSSVISILAILTLFLFGLQGLSREMQTLIQGPLKVAFIKLTNHRLMGLVTGAVATSIIQSSSAITALAVTLVHGQVLSFRNILSILIGANIGTASTAFLVSFKLENIGAYLIVSGSLIGLVPHGLRVIGKSLFYFGFILFILEELGSTIQNNLDPNLIKAWITTQTPALLVLIYGTLGSAIFQSSSLITGLAVLFVQQDILTTERALLLVLGANIGTTSTSLLASLALNKVAKQAAIANFLFNFMGALIILPFINYLAYWSLYWSGNQAGLSVAVGHLIFNSLLAVLFLPFTPWISRWQQRYL